MYKDYNVIVLLLNNNLGSLMRSYTWFPQKGSAIHSPNNL
jgi:hypothetical protein